MKVIQGTYFRTISEQLEIKIFLTLFYLIDHQSQQLADYGRFYWNITLPKSKNQFKKN